MKRERKGRRERGKEGDEREEEREGGDAINMGQYLIIIQDTRNLIKTTPPEWSHKEKSFHNLFIRIISD